MEEDKKRIEMQKEKNKKHAKKIETIESNRDKLNQESETRKKELIERMDTIDKRVEDKRQEQQNASLKKQEESKVKQEQKSILIQRKMRSKEYQNKKRMDELEEKDRKLEEFKQKKLVADADIRLNTIN